MKPKGTKMKPNSLLDKCIAGYILVAVFWGILAASNYANPYYTGIQMAQHGLIEGLIWPYRITEVFWHYDY